MISRAELRQLAEFRLEDAQLLLSFGRHSSAYYVAGYAVELGLKAAISQQFYPEFIPDRRFVNDIHTHDLVKLVGLAGLTAQLDSAKRDGHFAANWSIATRWSEASRYEIIDPSRATEVVEAIADSRHGVMQWLKLHW